MGYLETLSSHYDCYDNIVQRVNHIKERGLTCEVLTEGELDENFPYLDNPPNFMGFYEPVYGR